MIFAKTSLVTFGHVEERQYGYQRSDSTRHGGKVILFFRGQDLLCFLNIASSSPANIGLRQVHQSSATSNQWAWYVSGVKQILSTVHLGKAQGDPDLDVLLDWVFYHGIVGRVCWGHWRKGAPIPPTCAQVMSPDPYYLKAERTSHAAAPSSLTLLGLLCEFCEIASPCPHDTMSTRELREYKTYPRALDWKLTNIQLSGEGTTDTNTIVELYRLAILVYVNRMSDDLFKQAGITQQHVDKAFSLFTQLSSCERQFPVFILGCEARTDEHRTAVLDLIARTEERHSSRSFNQVKKSSQDTNEGCLGPRRSR